jgi:hypothetical protein
MVWLTEKKVFYHILDLGFESAGIPIRVKFEFEVRDGVYVSQSLRFSRLYNPQVLRNRYPNLQTERLKHDIDETVKQRIRSYLIENGYLGQDSHAGNSQ